MIRDNRSERSIEIIMSNEKIQKHMDKENYADFLRNETCIKESIAFNKISEEQAETVRANVASLPWEERAVVFLKFWDGMSIEEISKNLTMTVMSVEELLQSGLLKIRKNLLQARSFESLGGFF